MFSRSNPDFAVSQRGGVPVVAARMTMQMRKFMYEPISLLKRATNCRADARACELAGYPTMAEVALRTAEELENRENSRRREVEEARER